MSIQSRIYDLENWWFDLFPRRKDVKPREFLENELVYDKGVLKSVNKPPK